MNLMILYSALTLDFCGELDEFEVDFDGVAAASVDCGTISCEPDSSRARSSLDYSPPRLAWPSPCLASLSSRRLLAPPSRDSRPNRANFLLC